jgi:hypothetical protein
MVRFRGKPVRVGFDVPEGVLMVEGVEELPTRHERAMGYE